jgi:hypothetical protein
MDASFPLQPSFSQLGTSLLGVRSLMVSVVMQSGYNTRCVFTGTTYNPYVDISMEQLGLGRHRPDPKTTHRWDYASLTNPPVIPGETPWSTSIYRGLVPAKNVLNHDFAVNGAMVWHFCLPAPLIQETRKKLITTAYHSPLWAHKKI